MPHKCAVHGCKSTHSVSVHGFPKDATLKAKWIKFVQSTNSAWEWNRSSRICSTHFTWSSFLNRDPCVERQSYLHIKSDAYPIVYPNGTFFEPPRLSAEREVAFNIKKIRKQSTNVPRRRQPIEENDNLEAISITDLLETAEVALPVAPKPAELEETSSSDYSYADDESLYSYDDTAHYNVTSSQANEAAVQSNEAAAQSNEAAAHSSEVTAQSNGAATQSNAVTTLSNAATVHPSEDVTCYYFVDDADANEVVVQSNVTVTQSNDVTTPSNVAAAQSIVATAQSNVTAAQSNAVATLSNVADAQSSKDGTYYYVVDGEHSDAAIAVSDEAATHSNSATRHSITTTARSSQAAGQSSVVMTRSKVAVARSKVAVQPKVSASKPKVSAAQAKVTAAKPEVAAAKTKVAAAKTRVAASKPKVAAAKTRVAAAKPKVSPAQAEDAAAQSKVAAAQAKVAAAWSKIGPEVTPMTTSGTVVSNILHSAYDSCILSPVANVLQTASVETQYQLGDLKQGRVMYAFSSAGEPPETRTVGTQYSSADLIAQEKFLLGCSRNYKFAESREPSSSLNDSGEKSVTSRFKKRFKTRTMSQLSSGDRPATSRPKKRSVTQLPPDDIHAPKASKPNTRTPVQLPLKVRRKHSKFKDAEVHSPTASVSSSVGNIPMSVQEGDQIPMSVLDI